MHKRALAVGMARTVAVSLVFILPDICRPLTIGSQGWAAPPRVLAVASQPQQAQAIVTYPSDGMTISGVVEITGVATHPSILWYDVSYAPGAEVTGESQWVSLARPENTQVESGVLVTWDTTIIPDGQYSLALTVMGRDDSFVYQRRVEHLTVNNAQPVASPTPEQATPEPMPTAVVGQTPTPVPVEQPATPTPRPSPLSEGGDEEVTTPSSGGDELGMQFDIGELRSAFWSGALITVMLFLLWALYLLAKTSIRWYLRQRSGPPMPWE